MATAAAAAKDEQTAHRFAKDQLKAFVERVERLEEEKKAIADDIRDVYAEAKGNGFDVKSLRDRGAAAQAGHQRAQGAGGHSGDLPARARHDLTSRHSGVARSFATRNKAQGFELRRLRRPSMKTSTSRSTLVCQPGWSCM